MQRLHSGAALTSCSMSWWRMALMTLRLLVSCISPPRMSSSRMKYAFSKLKIMSSSQTLSKYLLIPSHSRKAGGIEIWVNVDDETSTPNRT